MIMALLKFIFLFFIIAAVIVIWIASSFVMKIRNTMKGFQKDNTERRKDTDEQTIIDNRNPHKTNKKIIPQNEGEYVDYEETK